MLLWCPAGASIERSASGKQVSTQGSGQVPPDQGRCPPMAMPEEINMASANKAVIVTGAASGIGLAMTMGLITAGHDVTAVDRNAAALTELGKQAPRLNRGRVQTVTADLALPDSFAHVTGAALIKYGRIDALVNNAGIGQASVRNGARPIRFWETTAEQWGRFIAVNAAGPINTARAVLPHMLAANHAPIVTVTTSP